MTSSAFCLKWKAYLAFILICHARQQIEGHPRTSARNISALIEEAYENRELLRPGKWSELHDNGGQVTRPVQRDTSRQTYSPLMTSVSLESQYTRRKLLGVLSSRASDADGKIIFPTDTTVSMPRFAPMCYNSTFCENVANYPRNLVNAAIARNHSFRFLESIDQMPDIEQRIDTADEIALCRSQDKVVFPQSAQNREKEWLFVVNQENLKQGIRVEICTNEDQECSMSYGFAEGYKTSCKQKFIYRELVAMTSNGQIIKDQFSFPSSCCCHVKFTGNPQLRLNLELNLPRNQTTRISRI
ncbi:uncharacterized protein spz [Linepithema humile]|uniref:uncharacterized protein spz n=1 Tax=Linepithema humile TaxID=83485 RepID=UPI000623530C|nr:PREDICTED: uncharacterized protein LOC105676757 [Linepithema humile]